MSEPTVHLSLILPIFNGASFVAANLRETVSALEGLARPFEVIVVCDGCSDGTAEAAAAVDDSRVRIIDYPVNMGKGHAVTVGLLEARGRLVGWLDADLDIAPEVIIRAADVFDREAVDAVLGSKRHRESQVQYPWIRRVYSWGYQRLVRLLFRVESRDTQVGAKLLRREMVDVVAPLLLIKRYAFDLEVLAVGAEFGFDRVREIPVTLNYRFSGTQINWRAVYRMLLDTCAIAYRIHLRHWYVRQFAAHQRHTMDGRGTARTALDSTPPTERQHSMTVHDTFYEQVETYESPVERHARFLEAYRAHKASCGGRPLNVLDVGCGEYAVLGNGVANDDTYYGMDVKESISVALAHYASADLMQTDLADVFPGIEFDVIFCGEVIEHVFSPDRLLRQLASVTKPNGLIVLSTPNLAYWVNRILLPLGISPLFVENSAEHVLGRRLRRLGQGNPTQGHVRLFTHRAMLDLLSSEGFDVLEAQSVPVWNFPGDRLMIRLSVHLGPDTIYLLRPPRR